MVSRDGAGLMVWGGMDYARVREVGLRAGQCA